MAARVLHGAGCAPIEAQHGIVTSASLLASRAGVDILKKGGDAIDTAVATAFTLAVTYRAPAIWAVEDLPCFV
jgi:gamma-glutamyltranspeptidase / glutathione hydrolase